MAEILFPKPNSYQKKETMSCPKVIILCTGRLPEDPTVKLGQEVAKHLFHKFGVPNVSTRIVLTGGDDRLLEMIQSDDPPTIFAIVSTSDKSTNGIQESVETHGSSPFVILPFDESAEKGAATIAKICGLVDTNVHSKVKDYRKRQSQAARVLDAYTQTHSPCYQHQINSRYDSGTQITGEKVGNTISGATRISGKVRDRYDLGDTLALVTTDRQSGFDRMLALVPYKGAVLNLTSAFWFQETKDIIGNHLISVPHPNVSIVKKCTPFPIEFVVR